VHVFEEALGVDEIPQRVPDDEVDEPLRTADGPPIGGPNGRETTEIVDDSKNADTPASSAIRGRSTVTYRWLYLLDNNKKLGYRNSAWTAGNDRSGTEMLRQCGSVDVSLRFTEANHLMSVVLPAERTKLLPHARCPGPP
jgi:hypothetical protein